MVFRILLLFMAATSTFGAEVAGVKQLAAGTRMTVEGKPAGAPIPGDDFYRALLRIWLGENPVQADLTKALLGEKQ